MHLYIKKLDATDCTPDGIVVSHDIVKFFFNPNLAFLKEAQGRVSYPFAHLRNAHEIRNIDIIKRTNGSFYIDSSIVSLLRDNAETIDLEDLLYIEQVGATYVVKLVKIGAHNYDIFCNLLNENDRHFLLLSEEESNEALDENPANHCLVNCQQIIYYGVPGCGKSHQVDKDVNEALERYNSGRNAAERLSYDKQVIRTVFHPDYCNADFVGQIMPTKKENTINYEFKPGPLANIIRKAYLNPSKPYFLIIEEINRGNAAAIFGEIFQLLDRYKKGEHSSNEEIQNENYNYTEGWSKYSTNNDDVNGFILLGGESSVTEKDPDVAYESDSLDAPTSAINIPSRNMHFSTYCGIRLPPNLSIYATMNTSDQNVFTLDNAFQRRWEMKQIPNKLKGQIPENLNDEERAAVQIEVNQYNEYIGGPIENGGTGVTWGKFREEINKIIMSSAEENGLSSMEDKRLGGWFITPKNEPNDQEDIRPQITKKAFAEKVLKYLWDDAFKFDRNNHFGSIKTLEDLIENFENDGFKVFVGKAQEIASLQQNPPAEAAAAEQTIQPQP